MKALCNKCGIKSVSLKQLFQFLYGKVIVSMVTAGEWLDPQTYF